MAKLFDQDENTIGWGEESIGGRAKSYQPEIIGAIDRLFILSPVKKRMQHYIPNAGYVKCTGGLCCELAKAPAEHRLGVVAFHYETDKSGNLPKDANGVPIIRGELKHIIMTEKMYARFREANKMQMAQSDGKEHLNNVDILVSVETEHKKQWKQWNINLARKSFFREWAAKAKDDEEIKAAFDKLKVEMKQLWEKLDKELARELTDQELAEKAGQTTPGSPDDLPSVGDPTDALSGLDE